MSCENCKKTFSSSQMLAYHLKNRVCFPKEKSLINCEICKTQFSSKQMLDYHREKSVCSKQKTDEEKDIIIKNLQEKLEMLENYNKELLRQNEILQNHNKELLKCSKITKNSKNNPKGFKELAKHHLRTLKINANVSLVFIIEENRYITIKTRINNTFTLIIWGKIVKINEYQRLGEDDLRIINDIFEEFDITQEDPDIRVNCSLFDKCIKRFEKCEDIQNSGNDKDNSEKGEKLKDDNKFFKEIEGVYYFSGSTLKKGSMESYKALYKIKGESYMLEQVPQRFLDLWETDKALLVEYLNF